MGIQKGSTYRRWFVMVVGIMFKRIIMSFQKINQLLVVQCNVFLVQLLRDDSVFICINCARDCHSRIGLHSHHRHCSATRCNPLSHETEGGR